MKQHDLSSLQVPVPRRRAARRADGALGVRRARRRDHRQLLADRDRLADPVGAARRRGHAAQVRQPVVPGLRLRRAAAARRHRRGSRRRREGRADDRAAAAAGLHDDGLGRRRALRQDVFRTISGASSSIRRSTGRRATRTATTSCWPHRRRDQRRRPPARHARDRGGGAGARGHRRGRGGRRRRSAQGPDAGRVRRGQGSGDGGDTRRRGDDAQGSDGHRRPRARRDRPAGRRAFRDAAAEDALGQAAAPLDPGAGRRPRSGRPDDDRGSGRARADQGRAGRSVASRVRANRGVRDAAGARVAALNPGYAVTAGRGDARRGSRTGDNARFAAPSAHARSSIAPSTPRRPLRRRTSRWPSRRAATRSRACITARSPSSIATARCSTPRATRTTLTITRSALKPLQAMPFVAAGGVERFGYTARAGGAAVREPFRRAAARRGRRRHAGARRATRADDLQCGTHAPGYLRGARRGAAAAALFAARAQLLGQAQRHARVLRRCAARRRRLPRLRPSAAAGDPPRGRALHRRRPRRSWSRASTAARRRTTRCRWPALALGVRAARGASATTPTTARAPRDPGRRDDRASGNGVGRAAATTSR